MKSIVFLVMYLRKNYLTAIINHTVADPERCLPCSGKAKVSNQHKFTPLNAVSIE